MPDIDIKQYTQIQVFAPATNPNHLITLKTLQDYVSNKRKDNVKLVLTTNFVGTFASGVYTATVNNELEVDGVKPAVNDRILLVGQTDSQYNGIYTVTDTGSTSTPAIITRADDWNADVDLHANVLIPVSSGTSNADTLWQLASDGPFVLDTTPLNIIKIISEAPALPTGVAKIVSYDLVADGSTKEWDIVHNLNTDILQITVYDDTKEPIGVGLKLKDVNTLTVSTGVDLPAATYKIVIVAPVSSV
jgi:hypothetical protein